jgi:hypothetical protein
VREWFTKVQTEGSIQSVMGCCYFHRAPAQMKGEVKRTIFTFWSNVFTLLQATPKNNNVARIDVGLALLCQLFIYLLRSWEIFKFPCVNSTNFANFFGLNFAKISIWEKRKKKTLVVGTVIEMGWVIGWMVGKVGERKGQECGVVRSKWVSEWGRPSLAVLGGAIYWSLSLAVGSFFSFAIQHTLILSF